MSDRQREVSARGEWQRLWRRWIHELGDNRGSASDEFRDRAYSLAWCLMLFIHGGGLPRDSIEDLPQHLIYLERNLGTLAPGEQGLYSELCRFGRYALRELVRHAPQSESLPFKPRPAHVPPQPPGGTVLDTDVQWN